jgi:hypothetical protein
MAFTVEDLGDLIEVLRQHPEWQAELRRVLIGDELAELRRETAAFHQEFAEAMARLADRIDRVEGHLEALGRQAEVQSGQIASLAERIEALVRQIEALVEAMRLAERRFGVLEVDAAWLKGAMLESRYRDRAPAIFGRWLHGVRSTFPGELRQVREARSAGAITAAEWDDLLNLDVLVEGRDDDEHPLLIALEVAWTLDTDDIRRAAERAAVLVRAGLAALPAVGGNTIPAEVVALARERGVAVLQEGRPLYWPAVAA